MEWEQDGEGALPPVVYPNKVHIDGATKAYPGERWDGYVISDGAAKYKDSVPGLTKVALQKLIKLWDEIPDELLLHIFGSGSIRVKSGGKVTCQP